MNESDEVWRLVHWKFEMNQIAQKLHSIKPTDIILLSSTMFDWIDGIKDGGVDQPFCSSDSVLTLTLLN